MKQITSLLLFAIFINWSYGQEADSTAVEDDFLEMDLSSLMDIEITSVSKKAERLQDVPNSIYVITKDDIANSGAINLQDLLRSVPGLWVASTSFSQVTTFSRHSQGGSLLYLLDGTPIQDLMQSAFSYGNFDIPLEEIERIEVIKGPGGTIYGANSATGVINIFTKSPEDNAGLRITAEGASPTFGNINASYGHVVNDKLSVSVYGKYRYFKGYDNLEEIDSESFTTTPLGYPDSSITVVNRFTEDENTNTAISAGAKIDYNLSDKTKISTRLHYNNVTQAYYSHYFTGESYGTMDTIFYINEPASRIVGNLRFDNEFSEDHSIFARWSTNIEDSWSPFSGGYQMTNNIHDFEIQDNLTLAFNNFSIGANYRMVNFNVSNITNEYKINFVDPQAKESIMGIFLQDKLSFMDDKLNITLGAKMENYSLVNDKYYLSPTAKFAYIPNDKLTVWGGYSQSYTTPGFTNTNIDYNIFRAPSYEFFYDQAYPQVYAGTIDYMIQNYGMDSITAAGIIDNNVMGAKDQVIYSTDTSIAGMVDQYPGYFNADVINGSETTPTSFSTFEFGIRSSQIKNVTIETNFFYTLIDGAIAASIVPDSGIASLTKEGEYAVMYYYGNYLKGTSMGLETVIRMKPVKSLTLELSHSWYSVEMEFKENDDFDISEMEKIEQNPYQPVIPEHVIRFKANMKLPKDISLTCSGLYATEFYSAFGLDSTLHYRHDVQRYETVFGEGGTPIGLNDNRVVLNLKIEKKFMDNKLSAYIFCNDILADPFVEALDHITNVYPKQIGRMYGAGLTYKL